uniref:Elongation factor 1-gamma n=1 Tax=Nilaparvata lugens TaxID=108931 RepID=A0A0C5C1E5_NILLU|nr:elongation factor 1-gamma [Nilaparvata lugens]APA33977.1 seminal fluid protein [Nilaparvata lugens]
MASGTLYTYPGNFRAYKALIAAQYAGASVKVSPDFVFGETNKSDDFLKKFPLGKVPAFESSKGQCITESNAIAFYVANAQLRGQTDEQKAQVLQWLSFADNEILPAACTWVFPCLGIMKQDKQALKRAKDDVKTALEVLNKYLLNNTYLVGERVTLADIGVACTLLHLYQYVLDPAFRKDFGNVNRWFTTIINQPQAKAVIGDFKMCDKEAEPKEPAKQQQQQQQKKEGGKKEQGGKKQKQAAKEPEPPAKEEEEEEAPIVETGFVMDSFKKVYSNEEETVSIPWFWERFEPENYSIWFGEYKYNEELTKVFMSCNLITGMFQRLDRMRKFSFASVCLFGTDNDSTISGVWVWQGQDLAFERSEDTKIDYESYAWTKLDPSKEETKKLVNSYFAWTATDKKGRKFNQGKIFK